MFLAETFKRNYVQTRDNQSQVLFHVTLLNMQFSFRESLKYNNRVFKKVVHGYSNSN
jgi:hypothetical protein